MRRRIEWIAKVLELVGASAASIVMFGCFAFGFVEIGEGFFSVFKELFSGAKASVAGKRLINVTLAGLEMFFLAPLPFLVFFSTAKLFRAIIGDSSSRLQFSHVLVVEVKRLITGLMIAVVSTELIHRISAGAELTPISTAAMLGLVAVLSLYYWSLQHGVRSAKWTPPETRHQDMASPIETTSGTSAEAQH